MTTIDVYLVTLTTPLGVAELEVPSLLGPDAAQRRAFWTAASLGWGDLDEIRVTGVELITPTPA